MPYDTGPCLLAVSLSKTQRLSFQFHFFKHLSGAMTSSRMTNTIMAFNRMTLILMTLSIMTFILMTFTRMTNTIIVVSIVTLILITFSRMTFIRMIFSSMTHSIEVTNGHSAGCHFFILQCHSAKCRCAICQLEKHPFLKISNSCFNFFWIGKNYKKPFWIIYTFSY